VVAARAFLRRDAAAGAWLGERFDDLLSLLFRVQIFARPLRTTLSWVAVAVCKAERVAAVGAAERRGRRAVSE
jgi:hypothetical protein